MKTCSQFLLTESPISVYPTLAKAFGNSDRAIVLQQVRYWILHNSKDPTKKSTHFIDDRWWTFNTFQDWEEAFSWLSNKTIKRHFKWLQDQGILIRAEFHRNKFNHTSWYTIDYERLDEFVGERLKASKSGLGQSDPMHSDNLTQCIESERPNDLYTETTNKDYLTEITSNQANKAFSQNAAYSINSENLDTAKKQEQVDTPVSNQSPKRTSAVGGINPSQDNSSANFSKKEKQARVAFSCDRYGVLQFPKASRYRLPSILAMRSMQFLLAKELECEFAIDADGDVWVCDPKMGEWLIEEEMFGGGAGGEQGHLSLKKMVAILNGDTAPSRLNIEWFNETAKHCFYLWLEQCQQLGREAASVIGRRSVALWLQQLDLGFDIELADLDDVA